MNLAMDPQLDLSLLRKQIEARMGLVFHPHQINTLVITARDAAERFGYGDTERLAQALPGLRDGAPVLDYLITRLTIGESFFFRDAAQMAFLRQEYLPALIEQRRVSRTLRIWSAAASSGQEIYSIAMLLRDLLPDVDRWNLHLVGTDINAESLHNAVEGHYQEWSMRAVDALTRARHFTADPRGGARVRPELQRMVRFKPLNLAGDGFPSTADDLHSFDLVLCRNVFIYFDQQRVREVLTRIGRSMVTGGVLMLGASDVVEAHIAGFETQQREGMCFFRRHDEAAPEREAPPTWMPAPAAVPALSEAEQITRAISAGRWGELVALVEAPALQQLRPQRDAEQCRQIATAYRKLGRTDEALHWCTRAVELAPLDSGGHFLHAMLLVDSGKDAAALEAFRRTLFLTPGDVEAQHQLALLHLRTGNLEKGLRMLRNAQTAARRDAGKYGHMVDVIRKVLLSHGENQDDQA